VETDDVATKSVIPAKAGIQKGKKTGFRVKPGMTIKVKGVMTHYTRRYFYWSRQGDLNPRPADYESAALPLSYAGPGRDGKRI
jgi:hypothetical protein